MARISYWGKLSDVAGTHREQRPLPGDVRDTDALRAWIDMLHSGDGVFLHISNRIALNDEIVLEPSAVSDRDTIDFIPPLSGG